MEDNDEDLAPVSSLSAVFLGHPKLYTVARRVSQQTEDDFEPRDLGLGTYTSLAQVLRRLERLGFVECISDRAPHRFIRVNGGGWQWRLIADFGRALREYYDGEQWSPVELVPAVRQLENQSGTRDLFLGTVDTMAARSILGAADKFRFLVAVYLWPERDFWRRISWYGEPQYYNDLVAAGLALPEGQYRASHRYMHRIEIYGHWTKTNSPMWQMVPVLWSLFHADLAISRSDTAVFYHSRLNPTYALDIRERTN